MIVPTGSTEQHNEHLAMIQDTASVTLVAQQAALSLFPQVMVATPVPVGISPHWMDRKGTLTLRRETFLAVVYEICESLKTHGITRILILNGHGGNVAPLQESVDDFRKKLGINLRAHSYWDAYSRETVKKYMASGSRARPRRGVRDLVRDGRLSRSESAGRAWITTRSRTA